MRRLSEKKLQDTRNWSPKELIVLRMLAKGWAIKHISYTLGVEDTTIKTYYLPKIKQKMGVNNNIQAVVKAIELGIITGGRKESLCLSKKAQ